MTLVDLSGLRNAANTLNAETDELHGVYTVLEDKLAAMNIGVSAWTGHLLDERWFFETRDAQQARGRVLKTHVWTGWELGYARVDDEWALSVREVRGEHEQGAVQEDGTWSEGEPTRLLKASRAVRLEAAQHLEALLEAIQRQVKRFVKDIDDAKKLVNSLTSDGEQTLPGDEW